MCFAAIGNRLERDVKIKCLQKFIERREIYAYYYEKIVVAVIQSVVCLLLRHEASVQTIDQPYPTKQNMKKYLYGDCLSTIF